jgi:peptide deformylase
MAKLKIVTDGDPVLRRRATDIPQSELGKPELRQLALDMIETMYAAKGVGLAAPQIGRGIRLFVISTPSGDVAIVNPSIIKRSRQMQINEEGCLSVPGKQVKVRRALGVTVTALTLDGEPLDFTIEGFLARVIQHEYDHLEGKLIVDYAEPPSTKRGK